MTDFTSTTVPDGTEMQRRLDLVKYFESYITQPVGIEWDSSSTSPTLKRIDANGNQINPSTSFFDNHVLWGGIRRCTRNRTTGSITYGSDNKGTGLTLDGTNGDVLVEYPTDRVKFWTNGTLFRWWVVPYNTPGISYAIAPFAVQRGGTERSKIYLGAYESSGRYESSTFYLASVSGAQPVTGAVSYTNLPDGSLTLAQAETYANHIGSGFGVCNAWTYADIKLRMAIEYGTWNIPSVLGLGVTSRLSASGYNGVLTGADSIDSRLGTNGTGTGSGVNGETPICWRGLENIYGNVFEYVMGLNMFNGTGSDSEGSYTPGAYRVIKASGTGTMAAILTSGNFLLGSAAVPLSDNYISSLQTNETGAKLFMPAAVSGINSTYLCDTFYYPRNNPSLVVHGGSWSNTTNAGPFCMFVNCPTTYNNRTAGCRLEYYP
ncbi:MAG: hypothetical protein ABFD07_14200 [Methanobacterium sp.]